MRGWTRLCDHLRIHAPIAEKRDIKYEPHTRLPLVPNRHHLSLRSFPVAMHVDAVVGVVTELIFLVSFTPFRIMLGKFTCLVQHRVTDDRTGAIGSDEEWNTVVADQEEHALCSFVAGPLLSFTASNRKTICKPSELRD